MTMTEKAAYLRGLVEGRGFDPEAGEGKLWHVLSELVGDMSAAISKLQKDQGRLDNALEDIQVGLNYLEERLDEHCMETESFDRADDDDMDRSDFYPFRQSGMPAEEDEDEPEEYPEEEEPEGGSSEVYYEVECPNCGQKINFDDETLEEGSIICPNCGAALEFDLRDPEEDDQPEEDGLSDGRERED